MIFMKFFNCNHLIKWLNDRTVVNILGKYKIRHFTYNLLLFILFRLYDSSSLCIFVSISVLLHWCKDHSILSPIASHHDLLNFVSIRILYQSYVWVCEVYDDDRITPKTYNLGLLDPPFFRLFDWRKDYWKKKRTFLQAIVN